MCALAPLRTAFTGREAPSARLGVDFPAAFFAFDTFFGAPALEDTGPADFEAGGFDAEDLEAADFEAADLEAADFEAGGFAAADLEAGGFAPGRPPPPAPARRVRDVDAALRPLPLFSSASPAATTACAAARRATGTRYGEQLT